MGLVFADLEASTPSFNSHDLSYLLWAFTRLQPVPSERLLHQLAAAATDQATACQPQSLTMIVYAFAKLRFHPGMRCWRRLHSTCVGRLRQYNPQVGMRCYIRVAARGAAVG